MRIHAPPHARLHAKRDLLLAHTLVHYLHAGHPYDMVLRSANALSWIEHGQYVMLVRLDEAEAFWRTRDRLARERGIDQVR